VQAERDTRSILDSLRRLVRELRLFSRRAEARFGLTAAQLFVLQRVVEHEPLSINALAELTFTHQSSVSVVAQRLEERGLLTRQRSAEDRRRKRLRLTPAGRRALERAPVSVQDRLIAAAQALGDADRRELARLLAELVRLAGLAQSPSELFFEREPPPPPPVRPPKSSQRRNPS
jgi:DNA-binding MarR family transcriptional regulator